MEIDRHLSSIEKLPTLPGIALELLKAVQKPDPNLGEISAILSKDPPLSAEILKVINSPFYSLPVKITSVNHAVKLLGIQAVKNLALSFSLIKSQRKSESHDLDYNLFWKESLVGAMANRLLLEQVAREMAEDGFFLGLLQNIGCLALDQCMPRQYSHVLRLANDTGIQIFEAENQILGFNHMVVGQYLTHSWGLPASFTIPIGCHHQTGRSAEDDSRLALACQTLQLSSLFIDLFDESRFKFTYGLIEHLLTASGLSEKISTEAVWQQIQEQTKEIFPLFDITINQETDYSQLIETARKELIHASKDLFREFLEQKRKLEILSERVTRDSMTGLINYQRFYEQLDQEIHRAMRYNLPLSVIVADIDRFKLINDTYGHVTGDRVIVAVADCLSTSLRQSDILARYGGEEFAMILPDTGLEGAMIAAERLAEKIRKLRITEGGLDIGVTLCFGAAVLPSGRRISSQELVKIADKAMYRAKKEGRDRCCSAPPSMRL